MSAPARPVIDPRDAAAFVEALFARRPGFVPKWQPGLTGPDIALVQALGRYLATVCARLNQAPDKHQLAMLDVLGVRLIPAQAARAPVVFTVSPGASDSRVPAGSRLAAKAPDPPPTGANPVPPEEAPATTPPGPILFETERALGLASGRLVELRSLWPGRDQSIDHMPALGAGQPVHPWNLAELQDMPHHLYLAHATLLALAGDSHLAVELELSQGASEHLATIWEYWDGTVWRPFRNTVAACDKATAAQEDSTAGLQKTGTIQLRTECAETKEKEVGGVESFWVRARLTEPLLPDPAQLLPEVEQVKLSTVITRPVGLVVNAEPAAISGGFLPDHAVVDGAEADLSKPFYPFGQQPQPGSVFYFSSDEVFTKPGAHLQVCFIRTKTPQDELASTNETPLPHRVAWEYWNGREWAPVPGFAGSVIGAPADLDPVGQGFGSVLLTVPEDMEPTTVADTEARWMRVRLVSGGYGYFDTVSWTNTLPVHDVDNEFTFVVSRPPAISALMLGYSWTFGPFAPERVLTYNDFQYADRTEAAVWPGQVFQPFTSPADTTPALYLGFDKPLPVDQLGIFLNVEEDPADTLGPSVLWEYWDGGAWRVLRADDETRRLRVPGLVGLIGPQDSRPLARFGTERSWLRVRMQEDGPPGEPTILGVFPNATWAVQHQTVLDDPSGASTGLPGQVLAFRQVPVLPGERIDVRELAGPRANVEWRIVALELHPGDERVVPEIEALLGREGSAADVEYGPLRLRRDRRKLVSEVWVRWKSTENMLRSGPNDRHYVLERSRGRLQFGDGNVGKVPPPGAAIVARRYQTGGGSLGNVPIGALSQLQGSIGGVEAVFNPLPAEGGADAETLDALRGRGPYTLRHRGRVLSATDLATMAREASPAVAVARALPARSVDGRRHPGHVTLVVIPASTDPRPWPSFGLREHVRRHVESRADAALAGMTRIDVTGPAYVAIDVDATIVPLDPAEAGAVEQRARAVLARLLHPLYGGPDGDGWPPGRDVHLSDLAAVLERVEGLDYVEQFAISVDGRIGGDSVHVADDRTVVAGELRIKLAHG